jgi:hypothetical protein
MPHAILLGLLLAADDLGAASQAWILKKSWIFEVGLLCS